MSAAVHDGRHLSSGYPDTSIYEKQRADEIKMVRLLTADSSDKRDVGLDRMKVMVQSNLDEFMPFSEPQSVFQGLAASLMDDAWEIRHKAAKMVGLLVTRLDSEAVKSLIGHVLTPMVSCLGDDKITVCEAAARTLSIFIDNSADCRLIVNAVSRYGLDNRDPKLKKSVIESIPSMFGNRGSSESLNLKPLVVALIRNASSKGDEPHLMLCLEKLKEYLGNDEFETCIDELPNQLKTKYDTLLRLHENNEGSSESARQGQSNGNSSRGRRDDDAEEGVVFGVIPSSIIDRLRGSQSDQRAMSNAIEELCYTVNGITNIGKALGPHFPDFVKFLADLLNDESSFQVVTGSLNVLGALIVHSDSKVVLKHVNLLVTTLSNRMCDKNVVVRKSIMLRFMSLMHAVPPVDVIHELVAGNISHRAWRIRQFTLDIIIAALLKHPSNVFDLSVVCQVATNALLDQKKAVRLAAMECVAVIGQAMGVGRQQSLIAVVDKVEMETNSDGLMAAVHARLARRQLPVVDVDGLVEYSSGTASAGQGSADADWIMRGSMAFVSSAHSNPSEVVEDCGMAHSTPPTGRRYLSATKNLSKMPWEKEGAESSHSNTGDRGKSLRHHNSAPAGDLSPQSEFNSTSYGRQSAIEKTSRSRVVVSPQPPLSMTWPNAQMFDDHGLMSSRQPHHVQQLHPLMSSTSQQNGGSESDRGHGGRYDSEKRETGPPTRPPLLRGMSSLIKKAPAPTMFPELAKTSDGQSIYHHDSGDRSGDEINDSLRQIRNSASKKQLNKIFERRESGDAEDADQRIELSDKSTTDGYNDCSTTFSNKAKETFFETKPRLMRRNTILLREGVEVNSTGFTELSELQSVSVIGKGYADEVSSGPTTSHLSKAGRDKRRLVKGHALSPLSSPIIVSSVNDEGDRLPHGVVGKAALSFFNNNFGDAGSSSSSPVGRGDDKPSNKAKFSGDCEDTDDRRFPVSPPAGVVGKSLSLERSTMGYDEETDVFLPPAYERVTEIERLNRSRSLRQRQPDKYHGAGENWNDDDLDPREIQNDVFDGYNFSADQVAEGRSEKVRRRRVRRPVEQQYSQPLVPSPLEESDSPENWKPFKDPVAKLSEAMKLVGNEDWERKCDGLKMLRHLAHHHSITLTAQVPAVTLAVVQEVKNLRSQVSRQAMVCLVDLFSCLKKSMDSELDRVAPVLLTKAGETNKFIREDAEKALMSMVENTSTQRALSSVTSFGATHLSVAVRSETAHLVFTIVELLGPERVLKEIPDKILPIAAKFLHDGSPETRYFSQLIFVALLSHDDFDRQLSRHVPSTTLRHIQDKLDVLRKKGPSEPPSGVNTTRLNRTMNSKGFRGNSAPSSETGLLPAPQVLPTSLSASGPKRRGKRTDDSTYGIMQALDSSDYLKRLEGVLEFQQLVENNHSAVAAHVTKVFLKFIPCLRDSNNRVKLSALNTLEQILPSMLGSMSNLTPFTIETVASNLVSSTQISKAAAAVLDAFMEHFEPATLLQPFITEAQRGRQSITIDMIERISSLIPNVRPTKLLSGHLFPFTWYLLREMVNSGGASATGGGRSSKLRGPVADFVTVLSSVVGPELRSASATNPDVTPSMRSLLDDLVHQTT